MEKRYSSLTTQDVLLISNPSANFYLDKGAPCNNSEPPCQMYNAVQLLQSSSLIFFIRDTGKLTELYNIENGIIYSRKFILSKQFKMFYFSLIIIANNSKQTDNGDGKKL